MKDLLDVYDITSAYRIMALAQIKVLEPNAPFDRYRGYYERSFISEFLPGVKLSRNTISNFISKLGQDLGKRCDFYQKRLQRVPHGYHILIGDIYVDNRIAINSIDGFLSKEKEQSRKDLYLLYAYDFESQELVCANIMHGYEIDTSNVISFIKEFQIFNEILVSDTEAVVSKCQQYNAKSHALSYVLPLSRRDPKINQLPLTDFEFENAMPAP